MSPYRQGSTCNISHLEQIKGLLIQVT